jgi:hypothetical protein
MTALKSPLLGGYVIADRLMELLRNKILISTSHLLHSGRFGGFMSLHFLNFLTLIAKLASWL